LRCISKKGKKTRRSVPIGSFRGGEGSVLHDSTLTPGGRVGEKSRRGGRPIVGGNPTNIMEPYSVEEGENNSMTQVSKRGEWGGGDREEKFQSCCQGTSHRPVSTILRGKRKGVSPSRRCCPAKTQSVVRRKGDEYAISG